MKVIYCYWILLLMVLISCSSVSKRKIVFPVDYEGWGAIAFDCSSGTSDLEGVYSLGNDGVLFTDECLSMGIIEDEFYLGSILKENQIYLFEEFTKEKSKQVRAYTYSGLTILEENASVGKIKILNFYVGRGDANVSGSFDSFNDSLIAAINIRYSKTN